MNLKFLLPVLLITSLSTNLFANIPFDSVGVENINGKKVILHKLDPKDNFYSIGRRYNISPKLIIEYNRDAKMTIGEIIKVPTNQNFNEQQGTKTAGRPAQKTPSAPNTENTAPATPGTTQYKVSAGETLYAISRRFNTSVEDITKLNNLKSTALAPGQILLVRTSQPAVPPAQVNPPQAQQQQPEQHHQETPVAKRDSTIVATTDSMDSSGHRVLSSATKYGLFEKNEKGVAVWIDDADLDANKKLILHRTAPIGTVIKITNPMTNRTTFAKVVGRINDNENTKDAVVVMTKSVAEALGALDKRFHVDLSYGSPNE